MSTVWEIRGLRRKIFSYLRSTPHLECFTCHRTLLWDPGKVVCKFIRTYHGYICLACMADEAHMYSCTVS